MNTLMIKDLPATEELTREALARVAGGAGRTATESVYATIATIFFGPLVGTLIGGATANDTADDGA